LFSSFSSSRLVFTSCSACLLLCFLLLFFHFNATTTPEIYTLSLHDALPICIIASDTRSKDFFSASVNKPDWAISTQSRPTPAARSEEHTSELQSRFDLVCRLLLEKKKIFTSSGYYLTL